MQIRAVLFDLDGTLLPMDQDRFTETYFHLLAEAMAPLGYPPKELVDAVWAGTVAMVKNDGECPNEKAFWKTFTKRFGDKALEDLPAFEAFYRTDFQKARACCGYNPKAAEAVREIKAMGIPVALATNPLFPAMATESRIRWAGLEPEDFQLYTTYENIGTCKPNTAYYEEIARRLDVPPENCLMVGNDVDEDMVAETLGMRVFLLTDWLLNRGKKDITAYSQGGFDELMTFVRTLV